jgi:hypothetical protein
MIRRSADMECRGTRRAGTVPHLFGLLRRQPLISRCRYRSAIRRMRKFRLNCRAFFRNALQSAKLACPQRIYGALFDVLPLRLFARKAEMLDSSWFCVRFVGRSADLPENLERLYVTGLPP